MHLKTTADGWGRHPSGRATLACTNPRPVVCVADWFLALVNNSSESNVKRVPSIMHCLPSKRRGWEMTPEKKWHKRNGRHLRRRSPWDRVITGILLHPGQTAQLPLSAEVSLRTIRSRWKCWHLAFPHAPLLPVKGCLAVRSTLELVPQHSLMEAQA